MDINGGFSSTPCLFTGGDCRRDSGFGPQNEAIFIGERRNKPPLSWEQTCILWPNNEVLTCSISFQFYCIYIYIYIYIIIVCYELVMIYSYMSFYNMFKWFYEYLEVQPWIKNRRLISRLWGFVCLLPHDVGPVFCWGGARFFIAEATVLETSATSSHRGLSRSGVARGCWSQRGLVKVRFQG